MTRWLVCIICLVLLSCPIWPQASTGTVSGTVRDQTGAVIPNAAVVLTNTATNLSSNARTNEAGVYFFPGVVAGNYRLTVEVPGMEKYEASLLVQATLRVAVDPVLRPGVTTTSVEVREVTPMVATDNPTLSTTLERARIEQLPVNGRTITTLLATLPGFEGRRTFGMVSGTQEWILDGSVETDRRWADNPGISSMPAIPPGLDSVQEFTVVNNAPSAKYSRPVSIVLMTKSGSNEFHGSAFETHRNNGLGVARRRQDYYEKPPQLIRNEFGASMGGPLILPGLYNGRNRTFWFASYEGLRMPEATTASYSVPTVAMRNGDFSELKDSQGRLQVLYDPWTTNSQTYARQPFSYGGKVNAIDPSRISPVAKYAFSITPLPTNNVNPLLDYNHWGPQRRVSNQWTFSNRYDHRISDSDQFYVRLNVADTYHIRELGGGGPAQQMLNGVSGWEINTNPIKSIAISWVHTFSPTLFSETLATAHRNTWFGGDPPSPVTDNWGKYLGLPTPFGSGMWPRLLNLGLYNNSFQFSNNNTKRNHETYVILDENLTKIAGKHELQFGFHYRHDWLNIFPNSWPQIQLSYSTLATSLYDPASTPTSPQPKPQTGSNLANFYLGVASYSNNLIRGWYYFKEGEFAPYIQDNWRLTRRLTLNLGLRYEYWPPYHEKNGVMSAVDSKTKAVVLGTSLQNMYALGASVPALVQTYQSLGMKFQTYDEAGWPRDLMNSRKRNFGPRLGFAYKALDGASSFVIRGGYSLSYFHMPLYHWQDSNASSAPMFGTFSYNPNDATQSPDGISNYGLRSVPLYVAGVNSTTVIDKNQPRGVSRGSSINNYLDPNLSVSRVHTWNFSLEKEIIESTVVRARFIGTHGRNIGQYYSYNDATPAYIWYATTKNPLPTGEYANVARRYWDQTVFGTVREYRATGYNNNTGADFEIERRYSKGYAYQFSYVISNDMAATGTVNAPNQYMPGAVPEDYFARRDFFYARETAIPKHRVRWNWLVDLPIGKGKWIGGNASGFVGKLIGGWQLAGLGWLRSNYFSLPTGNWNITGEPIKLYGYQYPIQNCTSGSCVPGYLWWNGYIPSNKINVPNGYLGIPADYKPAVTPLIPWGSTTLPPNAPSNTNISSYWDTNNVWIPLNTGAVQRVGYNPGLHPWQNQRLPSVRQWNLDASLFKNVQLTERFNLRFNADFFNVLNAPNNPNSVGGDGMLTTRNSGIPARMLQLSLRLSW